MSCCDAAREGIGGGAGREAMFGKDSNLTLPRNTQRSN